MLRFLLLAFAFGVTPITAAAAQEAERCGALVERDGRITTEVVEGYSVLYATPPFLAPQVQGKLRGIMCGRETLHMSANDYHVLTDLDVPLSITDGDRVVTLEISDGQLSVRFLNGAATPDEMQGFQTALNEMQIAMDHPAR